jgi:low affinity Fe/Cu permease
MISWILLIALIITAITIVLGISFGYTKGRAFRKCMFIEIGVCAILLTFCMVLGGIYANDIADLKTQYEDIMLYHEVVNECDDEAVRFGHYEKIYDFNERYHEMEVIAEDNVFGNLVPADWSDGFGPITFVFRGGHVDG